MRSLNSPKNLSDFLELYARLGQEYGYTFEELSYSNIQLIRELYIGSHSNELFELSIRKGQTRLRTCTKN